MSGAHLFVPMLHRNDAIGKHTMAVRDTLRAAGVRSQIYADRPDPQTVADTRPYLDYESASEPGDVLIYQLATQSKMAEWLATRREGLVLNHHNITPPEFFGPWNNAIARLQVGALQQLSTLAPRAVLGIADSVFNAAELESAGCPRTTVVPVAGIPVPPVDPGEALIERVRARQRGPGTRWLSVGRLAPNKAHHHTIAALFVARATTDPRATLTLVGAGTEPAYARALRRYAAALGLAEAVGFVEGISDAELAAYYRCVDVLVMLSDHEGFGVPLVEAMGQGTPIVAFDAGAVNEVLDDCGVLLEEKAPRTVARAVSDLMHDRSRRDRMVQSGRQRFDALGLDRAADRLVRSVQEVLTPVASRS
ncbi:MAG: glycosyltransferase family 4 protein [Acidimicrobiales bacterium]